VPGFPAAARVDAVPTKAAEADPALPALTRHGKRRGHPAKLHPADCFIRMTSPSALISATSSARAVQKYRAGRLTARAERHARLRSQPKPNPAFEPIFSGTHLIKRPNQSSGNSHCCKPIGFDQVRHHACSLNPLPCRPAKSSSEVQQM
jgi:hypothetical protein